MCGYTAKNGTKLDVNGKFDYDTEYALKAWQKKHGLTSDGVFGEKSQDKFYSTGD